VGVLAATLLEDALAREQMRELDVLKSEFIALAAHELRNPLSSIYGISVTLNEREGELAEQERLALRDTLLDQTTRMRTLAEQLLDLSRLDLTAIRISPEPVRLRPKIRSGPSLVEAERGDDRGSVDAGGVDPAALDRMLRTWSRIRSGTATHRSRSPRSERTGTFVVVEDRGNGVRMSSSSPVRLVRAQHRSLGQGDGSGLGLSIPRLTLELMEERSCTSRRCRTERDSRS
jgi:K+-sensing histidine kinase KdpD